METKKKILALAKLRDTDKRKAEIVPGYIPGRNYARGVGRGSVRSGDLSPVPYYTRDVTAIIRLWDSHLGVYSVEWFNAYRVLTDLVRATMDPELLKEEPEALHAAVVHAGAEIRCDALLKYLGLYEEEEEEVQLYAVQYYNASGCVYDGHSLSLLEATQIWDKYQEAFKKDVKAKSYEATICVWKYDPDDTKSPYKEEIKRLDSETCTIVGGQLYELKIASHKNEDWRNPDTNS